MKDHLLSEGDRVGSRGSSVRVGPINSDAKGSVVFSSTSEEEMIPNDDNSDSGYRDHSDGMFHSKCSSVHREAGVYVLDAVHARPLLGRMNHASRVRLHDFYYSWKWRTVATITVVALCSLVLIEHPYTLSLTNDPTFSKMQCLSNRESAAIELSLSVILAIDFFMVGKLLGAERAKASKWWAFQVSLLAIIAINALVCLVFPLFPRPSRLARPLLFVFALPRRAQGVCVRRAVNAIHHDNYPPDVLPFAFFWCNRVRLVSRHPGGRLRSNCRADLSVRKRSLLLIL